MVTGREKIYDDAEGFIPPKWWHRAVGIAIVALLYTFYAIYEYERSGGCQGLLFPVAIFWVLAPPAWFCFEYFYLLSRFGGKVEFETFKYGQDVASKAWLGVAALVLAVFTR